MNRWIWRDQTKLRWTEWSTVEWPVSLSLSLSQIQWKFLGSSDRPKLASEDNELHRNRPVYQIITNLNPFLSIQGPNPVEKYDFYSCN